MRLRRLLETRAPAAVVLVRLTVGAVFLSEGIQKFLYPADLGVGRFTKIGLPGRSPSPRSWGRSRSVAGSSCSSDSRRGSRP